MTDDRFTIEHHPDELEYLLIDQEAEGGPAAIGEVTYISRDYGSAAPIRRILVHTGVREAYEGQGLASKLVRFVLDDSIAAGATSVPMCPYIVSWVEKHPEYAEYTVAATADDKKAISEQ